MSEAYLACAFACLFVALYWTVIPSHRRRQAILVATLVALVLWQPVFTGLSVAYCFAIYRVGRGVRLGGEAHGTRRLAVFTVLLWIGASLAAPLLGAAQIHSYVVPLGLSYLTFRAIHYLIECERETFEGEHGFSEFLLYMVFLPTYLAGPIERFERFTETGREALTREDLWIGVRRIALGIGKKVVVADFLLHDTLGAFSLHLLHAKGDLSTSAVWLQLLLCYLYAYLDFSALSDLAIGASRLLGYEICENFNWPIFARDPGEFWQRWHMSLAGFCRYYVYLYVVGLSRSYFLAFLLTMVTMGLWHDLTLQWVLWGVHHAIGLYGFVRLRAALSRRDWLNQFNSVGWIVPRVLLTGAYVTLGYAWVAAPSVTAAVDILAIALGVK